MSTRLSAVLLPTLWLMAGVSLVSVLFVARLSLLESALDIPRDSFEFRSLAIALQLTIWLCSVFALLYFVLPHIVKHSMNWWLGGLHFGGTLLFLVYGAFPALRFAWWLNVLHRTDNSCYSYDGGTTPTGYMVLGLAFIAQIGFVANILLSARRTRRVHLNS